MKEKLEKLLQDNQDVYFEYLKDFVNIDTHCINHGVDGGLEKLGLEYLEDVLKKMDFDFYKQQLDDKIVSKAIEKYNEGTLGHNFTNRYNLIANKKFGTNNKKISFNGHVDTMDSSSEWTVNPHECKIVDDRAYGLGITDMKAGIISSLLAIKLLEEAKVPLNGELEYIFVSDEEGGGIGSINHVMHKTTSDLVVVCEPSNEKLITAHMGFLIFDVFVYGKSVHSGSKWTGENAILYAMEIIKSMMNLDTEWNEKYSHPLLPRPNINVGKIVGGEAASSVPNSCSFSVCIHYLPCMSRDVVLDDVKSKMDTVIDKYDWLINNQPQMIITQQGSPFENTNQDTISRLLNTLDNKYDIAGTGSGCDARLYSNILNIPTVIFGPGLLRDCHIVDESIDINEFYKFIINYALIIYEYLK